MHDQPVTIVPQLVVHLFDDFLLEQEQARIINVGDLDRNMEC